MWLKSFGEVRSLFSRLSLIRPSRLIPALVGGQFLLWITLFPEEPTISNGEPKCHSVGAFVMFCAMFAFLMVGVWWGERGSIRQPEASRSLQEQRAHKLFRLGIWTFWPVVISFIYQFQLFIRDPARIVEALFVPSAINVAAKEMRESAVFGMASFSTLLSIVTVTMALAQYSPALCARERRTARLYLVGSGFISLALSTLGMARQSLLLYILVVLGAWAIGGHRVSRMRITLVVTITLLLFWAQTVSRQGLVIALQSGMPVMSWPVQQQILAEIVEGYAPSEMNRALILLSYPADPRENYLYGTAFDRFHPGYDPDGHYVNTVNVLALWYWQLGALGFILALGVGYWSGRTYRSAHRRSFQLDWSTCRLLLVFSGLCTMIRDNFVFLQFFFVPLLFLSICETVWGEREAVQLHVASESVPLHSTD